MFNYGRRRFLFSLPPTVLFLLTSCHEAVNGIFGPTEPTKSLDNPSVLNLPADSSGSSVQGIGPDPYGKFDQSISEFLSSRLFTQYEYNPEWLVPPNTLLLTSLGNWGPGAYKYYLNDVFVKEAINLASFNRYLHKLSVKKYIDGFWVEIIHWPKLLRPHDLDISDIEAEVVAH